MCACECVRVRTAYILLCDLLSGADLGNNNKHNTIIYIVLVMGQITSYYRYDYNCVNTHVYVCARVSCLSLYLFMCVYVYVCRSSIESTCTHI